MASSSVQHLRNVLVGLAIVVILVLLYTSLGSGILGASPYQVSQAYSALRPFNASISTNSEPGPLHQSASNNSISPSLNANTTTEKGVHAPTTLVWEKWTPTNNVSQTLRLIYASMYEFAEVPHSKFFHRIELASQPKCSSIPPNMVGPIKVYQEYFPISELSSLNFYVKPGGSYRPSYCQPRSSLAIIIPYRNREHHLSILLLNLHPFLQKQEMDYTIFVVNQVPGSKFNRALLMNIGFWEAMKIRKYDCIIFHDVDLLPENDKNFYQCSDDHPRHMSVAVDKFKYQLPYKDIFGGIVAIPWDMFMQVNGYSNVFFGWGGEDDDFSQRVRAKKYIIVRYPSEIARYQMIKHDSDEGNEANSHRFEMLKHVQSRIDHDGLNSLTYKRKSIELLPLYTRLNVEIDQTDVMNAEKHSLADFPYSSERWKPS